jgi:hypothetical protein
MLAQQNHPLINVDRAYKRVWKHLFGEIDGFESRLNLREAGQRRTHLCQRILDPNAALRPHALRRRERPRMVITVFIERSVAEIQIGFRRPGRRFRLFQQFVCEPQEIVVDDADVFDNLRDCPLIFIRPKIGLRLGQIRDCGRKLRLRLFVRGQNIADGVIDHC